MLFGERLAQVRKSKKVSQDALAKSIGAHAPVIGRYERNEVKPSIEVACKIAEALDVSLDYLVGNSDVIIDLDLVSRVNDIQKLPDNDKDTVFKLLDAFLRDFKAKQAYS